jgi:L-rhamnonate dehydratase
MGEDPFDIERVWDIQWRSTMQYGRMGVTMNAISGVDLALWDLIGNALGIPVYKLLGGQTKDRIPAYCTGNDIEQHVEFGFKRLKLAMPHGPADGREGMRKNEELVKRARAALGKDGDVMLDCWMAWTERYTLEMASMLEPYRVYWMEEVLPSYDYAAFGRLRKSIVSTRIVTGEHEYGRYGFRYLLEHEAAEIWQPISTGAAD